MARASGTARTAGGRGTYDVRPPHVGAARCRDPVVFQFSITPDSRGVSLVEGEDATEPFASADAADGRGRIARREGDDVAQALVVALGVVVLHELVHDGAQVTLAERDDVPQALCLIDRTNLSA
jgi:hypothetical protein